MNEYVNHFNLTLNFNSITQQDNQAKYNSQYKQFMQTRNTSKDIWYVILQVAPLT